MRNVKGSQFQREGPTTEKARFCLVAVRAKGTMSTPRSELLTRQTGKLIESGAKLLGAGRIPETRIPERHFGRIPEIDFLSPTRKNIINK